MHRLGVDEEGLSSVEVERRLALHGPNRLPQAGGPSAAALLLAQVHTPLMYALLLSALVALALGELEDGLVVLAVVLGAAGAGRPAADAAHA
jgi:magnesium-transporting ATPase (P-type)